MTALLDWFWRLLNHGEADPVDDDRIVEAGYMGLVAGQMVMARLQDEGIYATSAETLAHPYEFPSKVRIFCRAVDLPRVTPIIEEVTAG